MNKIILTICLLTFVLSGFAQESEKALSVSVKSGMAFANMYGPDVESETFLNGDNTEGFYANHPASDAFKTGADFGLLIDYRFNKYISVGLGTSYIQKGAKINANKHWNSDLQTYENVDGDIYWNQNFWTLKIPLTLYIPLKQNEIYFQAGLFNGFLINSEEKGDISIIRH